MRWNASLLLFVVPGAAACAALHHPPLDASPDTVATTRTIAAASVIADAPTVVAPVPAVERVSTTAMTEHASTTPAPEDGSTTPATEGASTTAGAALPMSLCGEHLRVDRVAAALAPKHRAATAALLARGARLLPELKRTLRDAGAPVGLAVVAGIESGFRPEARGQRGERGLWQLKVDRARRLGLVVTSARDDRLDPALATRAAARHLLALRRTYGEWALALAAYAAGQGRVDRALRAHPGATVWQLADEARLPRTARDFVANVFVLVRVGAPEECPAVAAAPSSARSRG